MVTILAGAFAGAIAATLLHVLGAETSGRAAKLLDFVIRRAVARLPESLREEFADEWRAEMTAILQQNQRLPATRAWKAICYCMSLLRAGGGVGDALEQSSESVADRAADSQPAEIKARVVIGPVEIKFNQNEVYHFMSGRRRDVFAVRVTEMLRDGRNRRQHRSGEKP